MAAKTRKAHRKRAAGDGVDPLVEQIIGRYAAVGDDGKLLRCGPRADENPDEHWRWAGNDGKPVMRDEAAARECARQLAVAKRRPQHAYQCPRSQSGHWHTAAGRTGQSQSYQERRAT